MLYPGLYEVCDLVQIYITSSVCQPDLEIVLDPGTPIYRNLLKDFMLFYWKLCNLRSIIMICYHGSGVFIWPGRLTNYRVINKKSYKNNCLFSMRPKIWQISPEVPFHFYVNLPHFWGTYKNWWIIEAKYHDFLPQLALCYFKH